MEVSYSEQIPVHLSLSHQELMLYVDLASWKLSKEKSTVMQ